MMDAFDLASRLFGNSRAESRGDVSNSLDILTATGAGDSSDGAATVYLDADVTPADDYDGDDYAIGIPTSPNVIEGDGVLVGLTGSGPLKTPVVISNPGSGDRMQAQVDSAETLAEQAEAVAQEAAEDVEQVRQDVADFRSDVATTYATKVEREDGDDAVKTFITTNYTNSNDLATTYATKTLVSQTKDAIELAASQTYETQTDAAATYATKSALTVGLDGIRSEVAEDYQPKGDYATTASMNSAIQQSASSIESSVAATYETKSDASATYATKTDVTQTVSGLDTRITTAQSTADGAYLERTATGTTIDTTGAATIRSLVVEGQSVQDGTPTPTAQVPIRSVGARNLLDVSAFTTYSDAGTTHVIIDKNTLSVTPASSSATWSNLRQTFAGLLESGQAYVFQCRFSGNTNNISMGIGIRKSDESNYIISPVASGNVTTRADGMFALRFIADGTQFGIWWYIVYQSTNGFEPATVTFSEIGLYRESEYDGFVPSGMLAIETAGKNLLEIAAGDSVNVRGCIFDVLDGGFRIHGQFTSAAYDAALTYCRGLVWGGNYKSYVPVSSINSYALKAGTYVLTWTATDSRYFTPRIGALGNAYSATRAVTSGTPFTVEDGERLILYVDTGGTNRTDAFDVTVSNVQLEYGSVATPYTQSENSQIRINMLGKLPAVIPPRVSIGNGNYITTDSYEDFTKDFCLFVDFVRASASRHCFASPYNSLPGVGIELNTSGQVRVYSVSDTGVVTDKALGTAVGVKSQCRFALMWTAATKTYTWLSEHDGLREKGTFAASGTYTGTSTNPLRMGGDFRDATGGKSTFPTSWLQWNMNPYCEGAFPDSYATQEWYYNGSGYSWTEPGGYRLKSLPNGTRDEMAVDSLGRVTMTQRVGVTTTATTEGITATVGTDAMSTTGDLSDGATVIYPLATPQTIDLGTIDLPTPADTLWLDAAIVPTIGATWWTVDGIAGQQALQAEVTERKTLIRQFSGGVLAGYVGNAIAALVNAAGSFDVVRTEWANGVPSILGTLATFGANLIRIGGEFASSGESSAKVQFFEDNSALTDLTATHYINTTTEPQVSHDLALSSTTTDDELPDGTSRTVTGNVEVWEQIYNDGTDYSDEVTASLNGMTTHRQNNVSLGVQAIESSDASWKRIAFVTADTVRLTSGTGEQVSVSDVPMPQAIAAMRRPVATYTGSSSTATDSASGWKLTWFNVALATNGPVGDYFTNSNGVITAVRDCKLLVSCAMRWQDSTAGQRGIGLFTGVNGGDSGGTETCSTFEYFDQTNSSNRTVYLPPRLFSLAAGDHITVRRNTQAKATYTNGPNFSWLTVEVVG